MRSRANDRGRINQQGRYTALDFGVCHAEHALVVVVLKWLQNGNRMTMDTHASHGRDALGSGIFRGHWEATLCPIWYATIAHHNDFASGGSDHTSSHLCAVPCTANECDGLIAMRKLKRIMKRFRSSSEREEYDQEV